MGIVLTYYLPLLLDKKGCDRFSCGLALNGDGARLEYVMKYVLGTRMLPYDTTMQLLYLFWWFILPFPATYSYIIFKNFFNSSKLHRLYATKEASS